MHPGSTQLLRYAVTATSKINMSVGHVMASNEFSMPCDPLNHYAINFSKELYVSIQNVVEERSEADDVVDSVEIGNGLEAMRMLRIRFDPEDAATEAAKLDEVLQPDQCKKIEELISVIDAWYAKLGRLTGKKQGNHAQ